MGVVVPDYLYHYTSINSLASILMSKKIRFASLASVDDLQEQWINDLDQKGLVKSCFVSCWLDEQKESIPMWKMYGDNMHGVRISLPSDLFPVYRISPEESIKQFIEAAKPNYKINQDDWQEIISPIPPDEFFASEHRFYLPDDFGPIEVQYTNDPSKLYPTVRKNLGTHVNLKISEIGLYKSTYWDFQKEWRFRFFIQMKLKENPGIATDAEKADILSLGSLRWRAPSVTFYDLLIDQMKFKRMKITLGPNVNEREELVVRFFVDKLNPSADIVKSSLYGMI